MQQSERAVQKANANLNSAALALEISYTSLKNIQSPQSGSMAEMLAARTLLKSQRNMINDNKEWIDFARSQVNEAKEQLKSDMIEHEKFKYLELDEIKKILKKRKLQETKELDEVALMTYGTKDRK
ncbi:flagellar export protein FliJ [bacterium]|nr:flagellar export protein FliJ [bacterium]MBU1993195.1 flagellar export protein FliJ [bacterium]